MVATLPRPIRLKLDQTLAQWRHWRCQPPLEGRPEVVKILTGGLSNTSVLVAAGSQFVVRIDGVSPVGLGLNRQGEWRALQRASAAGLAPCPRYFNPDIGSLVCDYLPPDPANGEPAGECEAAGERELGAIAQLLRGLHRLPALHHRLELKERIGRYRQQLRHRGVNLPARLLDCSDRVQTLLERIEDRPRTTAVCHNDLLAGNRLWSGGRLWALDFEYCAMGDPWFDLAVVAAGDDLTRTQQVTLLRHYLGRHPSAGEMGQLLEYCCIYRYTEQLWYALVARESPGEAALDRLESALRALGP